jgi:hypothetical protein
MREISEIIAVVAVLILVIVMAVVGIYKLGKMYISLPEKPPKTEEWIGLCISDELNEEDYQRQYERADVDKFKERCQFKGVRRDIMGCYGDDHYEFLCPIN